MYAVRIKRGKVVAGIPAAPGSVLRPGRPAEDVLLLGAPGREVAVRSDLATEGLLVSAGVGPYRDLRAGPPGRLAGAPVLVLVDTAQAGPPVRGHRLVRIALGRNPDAVREAAPQPGTTGGYLAPVDLVALHPGDRVEVIESPVAFGDEAGPVAADPNAPGARVILVLWHDGRFVLGGKPSEYDAWLAARQGRRDAEGERPHPAAR